MFNTLTEEIKGKTFYNKNLINNEGLGFSIENNFNSLKNIIVNFKHYFLNKQLQN